MATYWIDLAIGTKCMLDASVLTSLSEKELSSCLCICLFSLNESFPQYKNKEWNPVQAGWKGWPKLLIYDHLFIRIYDIRGQDRLMVFKFTNILVVLLSLTTKSSCHINLWIRIKLWSELVEFLRVIYVDFQYKTLLHKFLISNYNDNIKYI